MARINIVNADNKIDATPQRAYFKLKQTGGPKGEKGDTGAQGPQGATGPQGASASVVVNSTTTLPAGSSAIVENIGTPQNVKLNFGIPTGPQGPQGEQGPQGAQGPQGLKGDTGAKGADGAAAKVTVGNTNTGAAGTNASVENTGSDTYAVLNFTIPRGDKGETGPMPDIAQTTGQATDEVMSQKATTDALATKQNNLTAGTGITIASDTVSADTTVLATKADLNDYAPQATTYTKTETDALLAPKLEADVVSSLPATGEEGKLYLTPKNYTRQTATGNPITATISDGAGTLEGFQLDGDTAQNSYTGKNLIGAVEQSYSNYGITNTLEQDGAIRCYGKCEQTYFQITRQTVDSGAASATPCNIPAGSYTLSLVNPTNVINVVLRLYYSTSSSDYNQFTLSKGNKSASVTITSPAVMFYIWGGGTTVGQDIDMTLKLQLESGGSYTSFEPYVGGTPSPNPDYPQAVQTVTGEQTVEIVGKNIFDKASLVVGSLQGDGSITGTLTDYQTSGFMRVIAGETYYKTTSGSARLKFFNANKEPLTSAYDDIANAGNAQAFTPPENAAYMRLTVTTAYFDTLQIELGTTATAYAPYHATTYPISLGSIELCKLGDYQDYIYKDGDSWKVHKATTKKTLVGEGNTFGKSGNSSNNSFYYASNANTGHYVFSDIDTAPLGGSATSTIVPSAACNAFIVKSPSATVGTNTQGATFDYIVNTNVTELRLGFGLSSTITSTALLRSWLDTNKPIFYYGLATPTDTTITDSTLIAQLEAIRTAALENGTNTITNSAADSNLAGDMEITYYGYNPTNRYDKFIWLDLNNNYEQIGE